MLNEDLRNDDQEMEDEDEEAPPRPRSCTPTIVPAYSTRRSRIFSGASRDSRSLKAALAKGSASRGGRTNEGSR
jgi:hypothetical protein